MGDEPKTDDPPTPTTPTPPSSSSGVPGKAELQKHCRLDISKLDATDPNIRESLTQLANWVVGRSLGGFKPQLKHKYTVFIDKQFGYIDTATYNYPHSVALDTTAYDYKAYAGWSIPGFINEGDTVVNRLGRTIRLKHFSARFQLTWSFNSTAVQMMTEGQLPLRMVIFRDKMSLGDTPTDMPAVAALTDEKALFISTASSTTAQNPVIASWNVCTHGYRYEILHDKTYTCPHSATAIMYSNTFNAWMGSATTYHELHIPLPYEVTYTDDATAGATAIGKNDIFICWFVDRSVGGAYGAQNAPYVDFTSDLTFVDN